MFGTKIRSWMEAHIVRPRKKQHRGNKDGLKKRYENGNVEICKDKTNDFKSSELPCLPETSTKKCQKESTKVEDYVQSNVSLNDSNKMVTMRGQNRNRLHNNNNLSSPESAYSTGYSTDGTSPGASFPATAAPPEYYINIRTGIRYFHSTTSETTNRMLAPEPKLPWEPNPEPVSLPVVCNNKMTSPALNSPRQRNRIRTNPWVPENIRNNCKCSPLHSRLTPDYIGNNMRSFRSGNMYINTSSPVRKKWTYTEKKQHCSRFSSSSSSSSTSSISSVHAARIQPKGSSEDEDDRTLNEMMGKYDESYVYEKETDILSDSDPTDCDEDYNDSDAEDGREGGDERDLLDDDEDFDFIDNGSLELNILEDGYINKGHCTYHMLGEAAIPLRDTSRASRRNTSTPTNLRCRRSSERRMRRTSSKKTRERHLETHITEFNRLQLRSKIPGILDGPRSAGNTPVCIRRRRALNEYHENRFEKRCNSVSNGPLLRRSGHHKTSDFNISFHERDKEADKKYKELIIEAEHILMSMKTFRPPVVGSPKRAALANKRVELIKNSECGTEIKPPCGIPEYGSFKEKLSPKKNHITNFINHNSPVMLRRDLEKEPSKQVSPLAIRKERGYETKNPIVTFKSAELSRLTDSSSCPQSEPVKRKIYGNSSLNADLQMLNADAGKIDKSSNKSVRIVSDVNFKDEEEFQQQKLFHTLSSLKRNLENQSEALKQNYGSSHVLTRGNQW